MSVDLSLVQSRRDRSLRTKLADDTGVKLAQKKLDEQTSGYGFYGRRRLLTNALRLKRSMAPEVAACIDACREILGYKEPLEVYIKPDPMFGAFIMKSPTGPLTLGLTSSIVEGFTDAELRFVVGHELGHASFDHLSLPMPGVAMVEDLAGTIVSRPVAIELYLWCRSAEVSADRAGLVCAQDINAAASAFLKLSSGLTKAKATEDLKHYMTQVDSLASTPMARQKPRDDDDTLECFSTHPYAPLRTRALVAYAKSDVYAKVIGKGEASIKIEDADAIVERDFELMEPSYLEEKGSGPELMRRVLFLAGMAVSHADGNVHEKETRALTALLGTDAMWAVPTLEEIKKELEAKIEEAKKDISKVQRTQLVQHLTIVAAADGQVLPVELEEMYQIAGRLDVAPIVVDETLRASASPMD